MDKSNAFQTEAPKLQKALHNASAACVTTKQHLLTRHTATFAHLYNTREVPNASISRQGVWGPQQGLGRDTQGQRDGVLFQHMLNQLPCSHTSSPGSVLQPPFIIPKQSGSIWGITGGFLVTGTLSRTDTKPIAWIIPSCVCKNVTTYSPNAAAA